MHLVRKGHRAPAHMLIKQLLAEGCNEPLLLQQSSRPILGGDSVFIGKKENCKSECLGLGMRRGGPHLGKVPGCPGSGSGSGWDRRAKVRLGCCCASTITVKGRNRHWLWLEPWPVFLPWASRTPGDAYHKRPLNLPGYQELSVEGIISLSYKTAPLYYTCATVIIVTGKVIEKHFYVPDSLGPWCMSSVFGI